MMFPFMAACPLLCRLPLGFEGGGILWEPDFCENMPGAPGNKWIISSAVYPQLKCVRVLLLIFANRPEIFLAAFRLFG